VLATAGAGGLPSSLACPLALPLRGLALPLRVGERVDGREEPIQRCAPLGRLGGEVCLKAIDRLRGDSCCGWGGDRCRSGLLLHATAEGGGR